MFHTRLFMILVHIRTFFADENCTVFESQECVEFNLNHSVDRLASFFGKIGELEQCVGCNKCVAKDGGVINVRFDQNASNFQWEEDDGGCSFRVAFPESYEELILEYEVKFLGDFGFDQLGTLPGVYGGQNHGNCDRILIDGVDGFHSRLVWKCGGGIGYHPLVRDSRELGFHCLLI